MCARLIRVARRHGRAAGELSEVLGREGCAQALLPAVLRGVVEDGCTLHDFYSHDGGDKSAASSSSMAMGKAFALGSSLLGGGGVSGGGRKRLAEGVGVLVVLVVGGICLHHAHAVNMLGDTPSGAKILLVGLELPAARTNAFGRRRHQSPHARRPCPLVAAVARSCSRKPPPPHAPCPMPHGPCNAWKARYHGTRAPAARAPWQLSPGLVR